MPINPIDQIKDLVLSFQEKTLKTHHRLPVLITSSPTLLEEIGNEIKTLSDSSILIEQSNTLKANDIIGHEYSLILYHLTPIFDPNFMAAISGTLKGNGIFIILCTDNNKDIHDSFYRWVLAAINNEPSFLKIEITGKKIKAAYRNKQLNTSGSTLQKQTMANLFVQQEIVHKELYQQEETIELIKKVITGHRNRPLTITANRGRGKSAAIGMAIGQLLSQRKINVIITAPSLAATTVIFKHIQLTQPSANITKGHITLQDSRVSFVAPDKLIHALPTADLIIIDEAAGLNLYVLESLLKHYSRIVFSTTTHGYEGSGQGFITRFSKTLDSITPQWKSTELDQPIRWGKNDPLENFINDTFMLSTDMGYSKSPKISSTSRIETKIFNNEQLINNEGLLNSIFSLLKSAHYKTSPNDLRHLMNSSNAIIFSCFLNGVLVAASITEREGNLPIDLVDDIYNGYRRPKGELIPQSIVVHLGLKEAATLTYLRIMRIAVHPDLQGNEIGSNLLSTISSFSEQKKIDMVSCSFGATKQLMKFWQKFNYNGLTFHTLRIGHKKNSFSGCHAILLALPISAESKNLVDKSDIIFIENFIAQLSDSHRDLDAGLAISLFKSINIYESTTLTKINSSDMFPEEVLKKVSEENSDHMSDKTLSDIISFCEHNRSYDDVLASIRKFTLHKILRTKMTNELNEAQYKLLILKILQNKTWSEAGDILQIKGKKAVINEMKETLSQLIKNS